LLRGRAAVALLISAAIVAVDLPVVAVSSASAAETTSAASTSANGASEVTERPDLVSAQSAARMSQHRVEITSERTESSQTYANPDGTLTTESSLYPVRVRRGDGWAPIDRTLVADGSGVRPRVARDDVSLSAGGSAPVLQLGSSGRSIGLNWPASLPAPKLDGATATYRINATTSLTVQVMPAGIEFSVILTAAPRSAPSWRLPLKRLGLTAQTDDSGVVWLVDGNGKRVGAIDPPVMFDSLKVAAGAPTHTGDVSMTVETAANGNQTLVVTPAAGFFTDPTTVYPVTVDPSVHLGEVNDTWVVNSAPTSSYAGSQEMRVGYTTAMRACTARS
jgi:hypothetical protein